MKLEIVIMLAISLFVFTACDKVQWASPAQNTPSNQSNLTSANVTNTTVIAEVVYDISTGYHYFVGKSSIAVFSPTTTIVIDAGDYNALNIVKKYNRHLNMLVLTLDKPTKTQNAKYYVLSAKPDIVMDNGIDSDARQDYLYYTGRTNTTSVILNRDKIILMQDMNVEFYVPFQEIGFDINNHDMDSIAVKAGNLLYMSNCYGDCEKKVDVKAKYLVLANGGYCPTNSMDFILKTGAKTIFGEVLCPDILKNAHLDDISQMYELGINFVKIDGTTGVEDAN